MLRIANINNYRLTYAFSIENGRDLFFNFRNANMPLELKLSGYDDQFENPCRNVKPFKIQPVTK